MDIARVEIVQKSADLDRTLDYQIPPAVSAPLGSIVQVPLGNRVVEGVVVGHPDSAEVQELKSIISVQEYRLPEEYLEMAVWLGVRAGCSVASALAVMLPPEKTESPVRWELSPGADTLGLTEKQLQILDLLHRQGPMIKTNIATALGISAAPVDTLIRKGILVPGEFCIPANQWMLEDVAHLTEEQTAVINQIARITRSFVNNAEFLLFGVTGSGKTEVYIRLARLALAAGRQALILVPEIALTAQVVARFRRAFGPDIAVLHSGLQSSLRYSEWKRIVLGKARIVIGTRSAVFAPLSNLGLIVMDEEHEPAYKQEETPRYHARDIALFRARRHGAAVVLGSATPALETFARAEAGRYHLLRMPTRIHKHKPVTTEVIDMRQELHQGNRGMLSRALHEALADTLDRNEQALLFLNRRGVAPTVLCRNCGFRYTCSNCTASLTLHHNGILKCHHCGAAARVSASCPECGSKYLKELGIGTQKLEVHLQALFPGCTICRLDRDAARSAVDKEQQLHSFYQQGSGILLGTQMIAKGLDFPKVTLVGIVLADLSLAVADFRGAERTFQLITQAAGRTGRDPVRPGRVIIQTYQPEHYGIKFAVDADYQGFFNYEMRIRSGAGMPPFSALTRIILSAREQKDLLRQVEYVNSVDKGGELEVIYSGPAPLEKLKGRFRWHFLLRHSGNAQAWRSIDSLRRKIKHEKNARVVFDNNPYNFM